ncbi:MAG TPA: hypothetical protein GXX75_14065 [Clostridiales bacterium]|nr:hypothetical protein [Clostridiales bacterium]
MLYTVRPLERIYADPNTFRPGRKESGKDVSYGGIHSRDQGEPEYREVILPNGRITTRREGEDFIVERINSTDMKDYLNADYSPGKSLKDQGGI